MSGAGQLKRWAPLLALAFLLVVSLVLGASGGTGPTSVDDRVQRVTSQIRCPVCSGETVADSSAPISQSIRAFARQQLLAGRSENDVRSYIIRQYPGTALSPPSSGVGLLVWALPVVVVVGAAGGLGVTFARWRARPAATVSDEDRQLVERARRDAGN